MPGEGPPISEEELTGQAPEEAPPEVLKEPEVPEAQPAQQAQPRRGWRRFIPWGHRGQETAQPAHQEALEEQEKTVIEAEKAAGQIASPEIMEQLARSRNPEDMVRLFENMNYIQFREMQLNERHGRGVAGLYRRFKAGELNFEVTPDGQIRRRIWMELFQKGAKSIFNRKTGIAVGTAAVASILSAGTAAPAVWGIVGGVIGRTSVEGIESAYGDTAGRRQKILEADQSRFEYMQQLARELQDENLSPEERQVKLEELVEARYRPSKEIACEGHPAAEIWQQQMQAEARLQQTEKIWERRADIGALVGGATAMTVDFLRGLHGLADLGRFDLDGDKIKHAVRIVNGKMQYAYRSGEVMTSAAKAVGSRFFHEIGPTAASVIPKVAAQMGVVLANWAYWALRKRPDITTNVPEIKDQEVAEEKEAMLGQVREQAEAQAASTTSQEAVAQEAETAAPEMSEAQKQLIEKYGAERIPNPGEMWIYQTPEGDLAMAKINSLNWENEPPLVFLELFDYPEAKLGQKLIKIGENPNAGLEDLIQNGQRQEEFIEHWAEPVNEGDDVEVPDGVSIVDQTDPRKKTEIPVGTYTITGLGEKTGGEVVLTIKDGEKKGQRLRANLFDLAFAGLRSGEPGKEKKTSVERNLVANTIWQTKEGINPEEIPENIRNISRFRITEIVDEVVFGHGIDEQGKRMPGKVIRIPQDTFMRYYEYAERVGGGQEGGRGQRQRQ